MLKLALISGDITRYEDSLKNASENQYNYDFTHNYPPFFYILSKSN